MTRSLGSLGTPHEPVDMTFDYFGVVIRVNPTASDLDLMGFMMEAADVEAADEGKAMAAIGRYLKGLVTEGDWDTFWRTAKANQQTMPDLMMLGEQIVEAVSGVPSEPLSDSVGGRPNTPSKSKADSSSPVASRAPRKATKANRAARTSPQADVRRALALVPDTRPDIKEFLVQAAEARAVADETAKGQTTAARMGLTG